MTRPETNSETETRCEKCGSTVFLVDETCTHVEIDDEIVKTYPGDLCNRNCLRCTDPELYQDYCERDGGQRDDASCRHSAGKPVLPEVATMDEEEAREVAIEILDEFEELLEAHNITIPSADREGRPEEACLYGTEYYLLEDAIVDILIKATAGENTEPCASPSSIDADAKRACEAMRQKMASAPRGFAQQSAAETKATRARRKTSRRGRGR